MHFLFWLLWVIDLLFLVITIAGGIFRGNMALQNPFTSVHFWGIILGLVAVFGGLLLRFSFKMYRPSLLLVALPLIALFIYYLVDRK